MPTTFERVQRILIDKYSVPQDVITPAATLETLGLDSLDLIELLFEVEDEFHIRVPQDGGSALKATTLQDIIDTIERIQQETPSQPLEEGLST